MTGTYPAMPPEVCGPSIQALKDIAFEIAGGRVSTVMAIYVPTGGGRNGSFCAAEYNSDIAEMVLELLNNHFKCDCGDPKCTTDVTRASVVAILEAYMAGDDAPRKAS